MFVIRLQMLMLGIPKKNKTYLDQNISIKKLVNEIIFYPSKLLLYVFVNF